MVSNPEFNVIQANDITAKFHKQIFSVWSFLLNSLVTIDKQVFRVNCKNFTTAVVKLVMFFVEEDKHSNKHTQHVKTDFAEVCKHSHSTTVYLNCSFLLTRH